MNLNETDYYQRRHQQERDLAEQAEKPEVRNAHAQLADEYAKRIGMVPGDRLRPKLSIAPSC